MTVSLSIKNVPAHVVKRLRERAARNRRSLQGELLNLIEQVVDEVPAISARDVYERAKRLNVPKRPRSADIIRRMRDAG